MISKHEAWKFAHAWVDAWNTRNIDQIMNHYADSIEFCSPFVQKTLGDPKGVIYGFNNLHDYITTNMKKVSTLSFQLIDVLTSPLTIVLLYKINHGALAAEVMILNSEMKATKVFVNYEPVSQDIDLIFKEIS